MKMLATGIGRLPLRRITRSNLLILCYHGFAKDDEAKFNPAMFMQPDTFAERVDFLARNSWPVLSLSEGLEKLSSGTLPAGAVVITADDGWSGTVNTAEAILTPHAIPLTSYVTTHYVDRGLPVSNTMLSYLLWKGRFTLAGRESLSLYGEKIDLTSLTEMDLHRTLLARSEKLDADGRDQFNEALATELGIDYRERKSKELFFLMGTDELRTAASAGVDIQLHGDRHLGTRSVDDEELFKREIVINREKLSKYSDQKLEHFCYPSGACNSRQETWLQELGIRSATTCNPGLNFSSTNPFRLRRFLDREDISLARFALQLSGIRDILR